MSDMSDFDQWFELELDKATKLKDFDWIHTAVLHKHRYLSGWQAAKQSMQGEVDPVVLLKVDKLGSCKFTMLDAFNEGKYKLYTHAPDSAAWIAEQSAEIARLQKELEEARCGGSELNDGLGSFLYKEKLINDCSECEFSNSDSMGDGFWWFCDHPNNKNEIVNVDKTPPKNCPIRPTPNSTLKGVRSE